MSIADFLDKTALVERRSLLDHAPVWTAAPGQGAVPCLVRPMRPESVAKQGRDAELVWSTVYFDRDLGLTRAHRLTIDGRFLAVVGAIDFNSMGELFAVACSEART